ncbi:MAG: CDP-glycerol glycerophosphotransferase family protein [Porcipelethomonas sp.]
MELKALSDYHQIENKKIICFGRNYSYINQLAEDFEVIDDIFSIIDNNKKIYGIAEIKGRKIPVVSVDLLNDINCNDIAIIITSISYTEIYNQLCNMDKVNKNIPVIYQYSDRAMERENKFREKYKNVPLENMILFRSGPMASQYIPGSDFFDNSRALFEYMLANEYNKKYKLVWLVKNPDDYSAQYKKYKNVSFLSFDWKESDDEKEYSLYYRVLCLAKYIFTTDAYGFMLNSRKDQIRVQLWHGCGFKTRVNFASCEHRYEYTTVISDLYADIHANVYGLRRDQVLVTGYAKHDWFFQPYKEHISKLLSVPKTSKYIFWLPTFRIADDKLKDLNQYEINPETGLPIINNKNQLDQLNEFLNELDVMVIIKLHFLQKNDLVIKADYSNIKILTNQEITEKDLIINRLLASADALISDYSSAAVDFLNTDKPIAFTLDDVEEYKNSRGFVFEKIQEWLPGKEIFSLDDFCGFIKEVADNIDSTKEKRRKISEKMLKYNDGNNCRRICQAFGITLEE